MNTLITHSPAETEALGEAWGKTIGSGWVIALSGDLGAGKTQLVKGMARGLGIAERVQSPTFSLVNIHTTGRLPFFHLDLYRLDTPGQIVAAGLEDYLHPEGVAVIEWADKWYGKDGPGRTAAVESPVRWVKIEVTGDTERRILYEDFGS